MSRIQYFSIMQALWLLVLVSTNTVVGGIVGLLFVVGFGIAIWHEILRG